MQNKLVKDFIHHFPNSINIFSQTVGQIAGFGFKIAKIQLL